jgi:hypothetical protein
VFHAQISGWFGGCIIWAGPSTGWADDESSVFPIAFKRALADNPSLTVAQDDVSISRARQRAATVSLLPALSGKLDETTGKILESTLINKDFIERSYGVQGTLGAFFQGENCGAPGGRRLFRPKWPDFNLKNKNWMFATRSRKPIGVWRRFSGRCPRTRRPTTLFSRIWKKAVRHELSEARSARIELLSTRAQNRESESALAELEEDVIEARMGLLDAMGQRIPINFSVPEDIPEGTVSVDMDEALRLARAHRPDLKIADRMMESARVGRVVGRSGFYPKVDMNGVLWPFGVGLRPVGSVDLPKDWNAGVTASWALGGNTAKASAFQEHTSPKLGESSRTSTESQSLTLTLGGRHGRGCHQSGEQKGVS